MLYQLRIQGGHAPPSLLKLVIKRMVAIRGALYFMFLGTPSDHPGSDAVYYRSPLSKKNLEPQTCVGMEIREQMVQVEWQPADAENDDDND